MGLANYSDLIIDMNLKTLSENIKTMRYLKTAALVLKEPFPSPNITIKWKHFGFFPKNFPLKNNQMKMIEGKN